MKTKLITLCLTLMVGIPMMAQKKRPTLEDLIPGGSTYKFAENLYGLQWWGDICIKPDIDSLFCLNPQTGKESLLLTREVVNRVLEESGHQQIQHFQNAQFLWTEKQQFLIQAGRQKVIYDFEKNQVAGVLPHPEGLENSDYHAASGHLAYTIDNNLYVDQFAVTSEPGGIVCGQAVHRHEFGIRKGTFWNPQGDLLAFYRMDESMVTEYPLVDITQRIGELNPVRYPMAGMTSHLVTVGIYNPQTGKTLYLNAGDPTNRYFTNISWSPDGRKVYLIELNRDQNHAKLCRYSAESGELESILLEEKHSKYVEPENPVLFLPWDDSKFIYQSKQDGFNHLYLYGTDGRLIKQLTSGSWLVQEVLGFNTRKKEVIFRSTEISPLQSNLFSLHIPSGKRVRIGNDEGVHGGLISSSGRYVIDRFTSPSVPRCINMIDTQKKQHHNLLTARNPFEEYEMPAIETGTLLSADGVTDLYYRMVKPVDFDPNKKYPAIVYVYGGPHAQNVTNGWQNGARPWDIYMANKGYILLTVDNRGSSNRGMEFENCTFRCLGIEEGKDQVKGAEFLQSLPYVDSERIGVHGWSFGGHMTTALMLRYPEIFKVGVAGGPVIDWRYYEIMYGERYMDTPESNPEGYEECDLKNLAGKLQGHLLLIHDDHDDVCVPQHTLSFIKACVDARTYPDLFIYPAHKHNVSGRDRVHLHEKITRYFEEHL